MKRIFIITIVLIICGSLYAQPDTLWTKTYGGMDDDLAYSVVQTADGGFILAGLTESYGMGGFDVYLIKTDETGEMDWTRTYGGTSPDWGMSVIQANDGGYVIGGSTMSFGHGEWDAYVIKTDAIGNEEWYRTYGGLLIESGNCIQPTSDGGYILAGVTFTYAVGESDMYIVKTDTDGAVMWTTTFGYMEHDGAIAVQQTADGGYIAAGWSGPTENYDVYLVKADSIGNEEWAQTFGGDDWDDAWAVQQTSDGGYIMSGVTHSFNPGCIDCYVIKTDEFGNESWSQVFGGYGENTGYDIKQTADGGYIVIGDTEIQGIGNLDLCARKLDEAGSEVWFKTVGGDSAEIGYSAAITSEGNYVITGFTYSYGAGGGDVYLVCLDSEGTSVKEFVVSQPADSELYPISPNPFNQQTTIGFNLQAEGQVKLAVYDMLGREVQLLGAGDWTQGQHSVVWDAKGVTSGVYFVRLLAGNDVQTRKVVLLK